MSIIVFNKIKSSFLLTTLSHLPFFATFVAVFKYYNLFFNFELVTPLL